jgi:hypothetical protein
MDGLRAALGLLAQNAAIIGILSAIIGFWAKHISDRRLHTYEAKLAFAREQLRGLYGPLFLLSESNDKVWKKFREQFRADQKMFDSQNRLTEIEKSEYIRWLEVAFLPCNEKMRRIIEANAHLFIEGSAPAVVLDLLAHFDSLNVVLSKLKDGTGDNVFPSVPYPEKFASDISQDYEKVVKRHVSLTAGRDA